MDMQEMENKINELEKMVVKIAFAMKAATAGLEMQGKMIEALIEKKMEP